MAQIVILLLSVAPQRLHCGAASLTRLLQLRASQTSGPKDAAHLQFVFVFNVFDTVELLVIKMKVSRSRWCRKSGSDASFAADIYGL